MNERSLFYEEEQTVRTAKEVLGRGSVPEISWSSCYEELLSQYRKLLSHAKRLMNVGDLMQKDLNARNEQLRKAQEREERLRTQLLHSQKMEAIGTLTGGISHDFNNLLTIINGYTEMILLDRREDDPIYLDLHTILEAGKKGAELVRRLQAFTKEAEIALRPLNVNDIVQNAIKLAERTFPKMIEIETILAPDPDMLNADAGQLEQVLMNLCINAKEAMPDGGRLMIRSGNALVDNAYCRLHPDAKPGRCVLIEISDTGTGMAKEIMDRIFEPFFTIKGWDFNKGTGLGLSVAKGIVEQHCGWITCESEPGKGTTFSVYFPAIEDSPPLDKLKPSVETVPNSGKILLVDDEESVLDLGKRILERAGYTVITAANGREALDIYAKEQSSIGLVVLDLIMPQMSGEKCLEELVKINSHVKVVVSTGHAPDPRQFRHVTSLAKDLVNKPYQMNEFLAVVRKIFDAKGVV
jgi:two-component system, cell cycle sensor histidine kinase and response regulator CckA